MNSLREAMQEYIDLRRGLGYKMHCEGLLLPRFVSFMEEHYAEHISVRLAVEWAQCAYQADKEPGREMPLLSTYLGHVCVSGTYWYLSANPELMAQAMARLERRWGESS